MSFYSLIKKRGVFYSVNAAMGIVLKTFFILKERILNQATKELSYSQYSEDLFIDRMLKYKKNGSYIDIGANHPEVLNNTKRFYDRGWTGINVEPNKNLWQLFDEQRGNDVNLNVGVGDTQKSFEFYIFEHDTLSTFSKFEAESLIAAGEVLKSKNNIEVVTLNDIFDLAKKNYVDFISIDTEGWDEGVLRSNDWNKNRAQIICVENNRSKNLDKFFSKINYKKIASNGLNNFYIDKLVK